MRRLPLLIFALVILAAFPLSAQETTPDPDCDLSTIQEWYDEADPTDSMAVNFILTLQSSERASARFDAAEEIADRADELADSEYPACIEQAVVWYVEGLNTLAEAAESFIDGQVADFVGKQSTAMQKIGQYRGYMAALGVELHETATGTTYMR